MQAAIQAQSGCRGCLDSLDCQYQQAAKPSAIRKVTIGKLKAKYWPLVTGPLPSVIVWNGIDAACLAADYLKL